MRTPINIHNINKKFENRIKTIETIKKELSNTLTPEEQRAYMQQEVAMRYTLDSEFKKNYVEFGNNTTILKSKSIKEAPLKYKEADNLKSIYSDIRPFYNFFTNVEEHTKKVQTGNELIKNVTKIDELNFSRINTKATTSIPSLNAAYDNFKKLNEFFVFDTETLSGMGATGYNELDKLQEIAFRKFKKVDGKVVEDESARIETLIGISEEEFKKYKEIFIDNFDKEGWKGTQKYEVIAERFAKLGHSDTVTKNVGYGIEITEAFASDESKDLMSKENIRKGLERARAIGKRQEAERLSNGLMVWEDQLLRSANVFNENFVVGYNSTNFDFEKMNQSIAKVWTNLNEDQKLEYSKILNVASGDIPTIKPVKDMYLDARDPARIAASIVGKTGIYGNDNEKLSQINKIGKTLLQQEALGEVFAKDAMFTAAHTAGADVTVLAHLMAGSDNGEAPFMETMMELINENTTAGVSKVDYSSVLVATQGESFNDYTRKGALNFTEDKRLGQVRTFNGHAIGQNVESLGKYGKATGIKKDVAYKIGFMGEANMSEEWVKKIAPAHQDYAQGKLWAITLNPLINKDVAQGNAIIEDPTTYFFTSKESMEGFVSSHFANIGNIDRDGTLRELADPKARDEINKLFSVHTVKDGKVTEGATQSVDDIVRTGTLKLMNDPAARTVRENEYSKAVKFQQLQDYLSKDGANTIEAQKKKLSLATAEKVAGGKALEIQHNVLNILGYAEKDTGDMKLMSSTLSNALNSYEYMASKRGVIDILVDAVRENSNADSQQKQLIYDTMMRNLREDAAKAFGADEADIERLINSSAPLKIYGKDLNYFEFDMPENYFPNLNKKSMAGEIDNVLRVNLAPEKEYSLVNDLLRRRKGNDNRLKSKAARESYGKQELVRFAQTVNEMDEYKGIFDDILYGKSLTETKKLIETKKFEKSQITGEYSKKLKQEKQREIDKLYELLKENVEDVDVNADISVDTLSEKIIKTLSKHRENNPTAGYSKTRVTQNVLGEDELLSSIDSEFVKESINKTKKNLSKLKTINGMDKDSVGQYAEKLVDAVLMPTVKDKEGNILRNIEDIVTFAQATYGYNNETTELFRYNLINHREEHIEGMTNLIKSVINNNGTLSYDESSGKIAMAMGDEVFSLYGLPRTKFKNGVLFHQTGQTRVEATGKLDVVGAIRNGELNKEKVNLKSNLVGVYRELRGLENSVERAIKRGDNPANTIISSISRVASNARELSAIGTMTTKDMYSWQGVDYSEAILSMPYILDEITQYDNWQDKEFVDIIKKNKNRILNGNVSSEVKEAFTKNKQDIVKILYGIGAGNENEEKNAAQIILNRINNYTKDGKFSEGKTLSGEYSPMGLSYFDNPSRPPISSADEILYEKEKLKNLINDPKNKLKGKIEIDPRIASRRQSAGRVFDGVGEVVSGVTLKNASISEKKFKEIVNKEFDKVLENKNISVQDAKWYEALRAKMSGLNLTEQGKIIDGRVAEALLSETETKKIETLKNFSRDINKNTELMQERIRKAMPVMEIAESGDVVFSFGKKSFVKNGDPLFALDGFGEVLDTIGVKENAGFFGFGYFAEGSNLEIGEDTISKFLNKNKDKILNSDGSINTIKAMELLDSNFSSAYYIKNSFINGYNKGTIEYAEKGMYEALLSGAGTMDERVRNLLNATGFGEANNKILGREFIDMLEEEYLGLSSEEIKKIGFSSWDEAKKAIEKEKYAMTDFVRGIDKFKDATVFTHDNITKHGNAGIAMKGFINNITNLHMVNDENLSLEDASKKTFDMLMNDKDAKEIFKGVDISFKDGQIIFEDIKDGPSAGINVEAVQKLSDRLGLYDKESPFAILDDNGEIVGYTNDLMTSFNETHSGVSRGSKDRAKLKEKLDDSRKQLRALDPEKDSISYKALKDDILELEHKYNAAKNHDKTMTISSRETDMLSLYEYEEEKMKKVKEKLGSDYDVIYKRMLDNEGKINEEYSGRKINQSFLDDIYGRMEEQAIDNKQYFDKAKEAITYNQKPVGALEHMKKQNFEEVKIEDLVIPNGHDTKFLTSDPNRSFGRNMLIDTGLAGKDKYIAVPETNYSITGDNVNTDEVQKAISNLQRAKNRLNDGIKGVNGVLDNGSTITDLEANVKIAADELKTTVVDSMKKNIKSLDSVQLAGYSYEAASMQMYDPNNLYEMYKVSQINGKTLGEWAEQGVHYNASWHGTQYFRDLGYLDESVWKDKYGMKSESEMIEYLSKHGTAGIENRTPTIKEGSVTLNRQFLDPNMKDGQTKVTAPSVFRRNQDHDGDKIIQAEIKHNNMSLVDYEIAKSKNQAIDDDTAKYFEEILAAQTYEAATINDKVFNNVAIPTYEEDQIKAVKNANVNEVLRAEKTGARGGFITPFSQTEVDTHARNEYLKKYGEIENSLIEKMGEADYSKLERPARADLIDAHISTLTKDVQDDYRYAARFVEIYEKDMAAGMAKTAGKASIGYINTPLAVMRRAASVEGFTGEQRQYIQAAADILEQNIISKKHSTDYAISLAQTFRGHLNDMFNGNEEAATEINKLIRENYSADMVKKLRTYSDIDLDNVSDEGVIDRITSTVSEMGRAASENKNFIRIIEAENLGSTLNPERMSAQLAGISEQSTGANKALARAGYSGGSTTARNASLDLDGFSQQNRKVVSAATELVEDVVESVAGGSGLAKAALGIAAAIMVTGYVGGNPTKAAGSEAQEMNNYESLQDQDLSIQQLPEGQGQGGYVININAQSPKGQDHAVKAIQKAMYSSVPTDINISMSVSDKTKVINSRFMDELLSGAL